MRQMINDNIMRLLRTSVHNAVLLAAIAVALPPKAVLADERVHVDGTFVVSYTYKPGVSDVCAGGGTFIAAQGIGNLSGLGPLFFKLTKCLTFPDGSVGTYQGTFSMTAGNGDTLTGTYVGTQDFSLIDASGFGPFQGTLTFTGGTRRFRHARGVLRFTALGPPDSVGASAPTLNGEAYYLVRGTMLSPDWK